MQLMSLRDKTNKAKTLGRAVLYISYDGMLEPLGQSQVICYLEQISVQRKIYLISFEKKHDLRGESQLDTIRKRIEGAGITWIRLRYHKTPTLLATFFDVVIGCIIAAYLVYRHRIIIVHARSYVASLIALFLKKISSVKFIFDMRGFWIDERVDAGLWKDHGVIYKCAKRIEQEFFLRSDHIVSLTNTAVADIENLPYLKKCNLSISVIPTCVDTNHFAVSEQTSEFGAAFVLGYVGSVGTWYLFDHVLQCFARLLVRNPDAILFIVNRNQHGAINVLLEQFKIPAVSVRLIKVEHADMPKIMARMNAGIFFIKNTFSKRASSPTRLAEYLSLGLPCLTNSGIGDVDQVLTKNEIGILVRSYSDLDLDDAMNRLIMLSRSYQIRERCRMVAEQEFSLVEGVRRYETIYQGLQHS